MFSKLHKPLLQTFLAQNQLQIVLKTSKNVSIYFKILPLKFGRHVFPVVFLN